MDVETRIKAVMRHFGIKSYAALARSVKVSPPVISQIVAGKYPGFDTLIKIAELYNISVHWMVNGERAYTPEFARDYADSDIEALEQLRMHLVKTVPKEDQESFIPRHPTARDLHAWIQRGQETGWKGDQTHVWRGWMRATSQLELNEIQAAIALDAQDEAARLRVRVAEQSAALERWALIHAGANPVDPPEKPGAPPRESGTTALMRSLEQPLPGLDDDPPKRRAHAPQADQTTPRKRRLLPGGTHG